MLQLILIVLIIAIILFLIVAALQPNEFSISRIGTILASPASIFPHVNNLHNWDAWSPWARLDPNTKNSFEGPTEGADAKMNWAGNNKVGVGSMTIIESRPNDFIQFKLEFLKPMRATNIAEFNFNPEGDQTTVTWTMTGTNNFMGKVMSLIMNCDKMVGGQFEQGLANLKALVETNK